MRSQRINPAQCPRLLLPLLGFAPARLEADGAQPVPGWGRVWPLTSLPPSPSCWLSLEGGLLYAFVGPAAAVVLVGTPAPCLPSSRASSCVCFPIGVAPVTRGREGPQSSQGAEAGPAASCVSGCSLPGGCVAAVYLSGGLCGCVTVRGWWADRWPGQQRCDHTGVFFPQLVIHWRKEAPSLAPMPPGTSFLWFPSHLVRMAVPRAHRVTIPGSPVSRERLEI